jgi:hypothetical protein
VAFWQLKKQRLYIGVVPFVIEIDRELIMDITHFNIVIGMEGFHQLNIVNLVGIHMSWEQSANDEENVLL